MEGPASYREVFRGAPGRLASGLMLLEFFSAVQVYVTATVLPLVSDDLRGARFYGIALSAGIVATFVVTPATAPLMARVGPRPLLAAAGLLHLGGTLGSVLARSMPVFALGRLLQGAATGALVALGYAVLAERFPARYRPRLIALLSTMWLLPALVGPGATALLATLLGWRATLLATSPPVLVGVALVVAQVRGEPEEPSRPRPVPVVAVAVMTAGAGMIAFGGSASGATAFGLLGAGLVLVVAGAVRVLPAGAVRGRTPPAAAVAALVLSTFAFLGGDGLTTLYVTEGLGRSIGWAATALSTGGVAWSVGTLGHARLLGRVGARTRPIVLLGGGLLTAGMLLLVAMLPVAGGARPSSGPAAAVVVGVVVLAWCVAGVGMGLLYPTLSVAALQVEAADAAGMSGAVVLAEALGTTIALAVGGSLVSLSSTATGGFTTGLVAAYTLFAAAGLVIGLYGRRTPEELQM